MDNKIPKVYVPLSPGVDKTKAETDATKLEVAANSLVTRSRNDDTDANTCYLAYVNALGNAPTYTSTAVLSNGTQYTYTATQWQQLETTKRADSVSSMKQADAKFAQAKTIRANAGFDVQDRRSINASAKSTGAPSAPQSTPAPLKPFKGMWHYNLPMVKSAYFSKLPQSPQMLGTSGYIADFGAYNDALTAWDDALKHNARGAIQMDRYLATVAQKPATKKGQTPVPWDGTMYGFRFLYNPSSIDMSWGLSTEVNWDYVAGGFDKSTVLAEGLLKGTVSFSILLNRIEDMAYLDSNGLKTYKSYVNDTFAGRANPTDGSLIPGNPYPVNVSRRTEDLKDIYRRGTMYDIEYLFKVIMGKNATYSSILNGTTADKGWLAGTPVELHLGQGLRYRVRISSLSVSHAMFNERMVPLLSTLNIECTRFYDSVDVGMQSQVTAK